MVEIMIVALIACGLGLVASFSAIHYRDEVRRLEAELKQAKNLLDLQVEKNRIHFEMYKIKNELRKEV